MPQATFARRTMESRVVASLYEGRMWRRSFLARLFTGISFEAELEIVTGALALEAGARVLDLGCGPGIYSRPLARAARPGPVFGLDLSPAMLEQASNTARSEGLDNLHFVRADAVHLPLARDSVDRVNCCGALHLFEDSAAALREVARVLVPGGRVVVAAFRRRSGRLAEAATRLRRATTGMDAYSTDELAANLAAAGFDEVESLFARGVWQIVTATLPPDTTLATAPDNPGTPSR